VTIWGQGDKAVSNNKIPYGKYVFEVFTVFLGVTLAFLVNHWQEETRKEALRQEYWQSFLREVESNQSELDSVLNRNTAKLNRMQEVAQKWRQKQLDAAELGEVLNLLTNLNIVAFRTSTYEAVKSGGTWHIFTDTRRVLDVIRYYHLITETRILQDILLDQFNHNILAFLQNNVDFLMEEPDSSLLQNRQMKNIFALSLSLQQQLQEKYQEVFAQGQKVLKSLASINR